MNTRILDFLSPSSIARLLGHLTNPSGSSATGKTLNLLDNCLEKWQSVSFLTLSGGGNNRLRSSSYILDRRLNRLERLRGIASANGARRIGLQKEGKTKAIKNRFLIQPKTDHSTHPQPLVYAFGMEFMGTGQHTEQLTGLEVTHAHYTRRLVTCE